MQTETAAVAQVVLYGIGSPIVVEYVESCRRLGWSIVAAVKNYDGEVYFDHPGDIVPADAIDDALLKFSCFCPLFSPANRAYATGQAQARGFNFKRALIDPHALIAANSRVGDGSFLNTGCVVGANVSIAQHVLVNRGASIGHHTRIGACASVGPGAVISGSVVIEAGAMIGAGAVVAPNAEIGAFSIVGAGAVVTRDVPACVKVVGNPAQVIKTRLARFDLPESA